MNDSDSLPPGPSKTLSSSVMILALSGAVLVLLSAFIYLLFQRNEVGHELDQLRADSNRIRKEVAQNA